MSITSQSIIDAMEKVKHLRDPMSRNPFALSFLGMNVIEAPPPPPKIQVRDIRLSDGTPILSDAFRSEMNSWLAAQFGYREALLKAGTAFMFGNTVIMDRAAIVKVRTLV